MAARQLEICVRSACGTWTRAEFRDYLKTTKLTAKQRRSEMREFVLSERSLRELCASECHSCSSEVLSNLTMDNVRDCVASHNDALKGGDVLTRAMKALNKNKTKKPDTISDCPQWDSKKECVVEGDACVPNDRVIGFGKTALNDGQCYDHAKIKKSDAKKSPITGAKFDADSIKIIQSDMTEDERTVVESTTAVMHKQFALLLKRWEHSSRESSSMVPAGASKQLKKSAIGAAAGATGAGVALATSMATGGLSLVVGAAALGAVAAWDSLRNKLMTTGISLVVWIVKNPKTAMMFLFIVKQFIKSACREAAKMFAMATYEKKSKFKQYMGTAKGMLNTIAEGGHISAGTILRSVTSGETWKSVWKNGGQFAATAVAGALPGGAWVQAGASWAINGMVGCAEEASRTGIEMAAYQKDIQTGMRYVGDILTLVINPKQCMLENGTISYSSCGELSLDPRGCRGSPECEYVPPANNTQKGVCREIPCEKFLPDECPKGRCKEKKNKCTTPSGWFSGGGDDLRAERARIIDTETEIGRRDVAARRALNRRLREAHEAMRR